MLSPHFSKADLLHAGETWDVHRIANEPKQPETWGALRTLCFDILEPVSDRFGKPVVTFGFASAALIRLIDGRIAPRLDQHAGYELRADGSPICPRLGQSADFILPNLPMQEVASWIAENLPFDRMYFYGADRPIHVSVGPDNSKAITAMLVKSSGRRIPRQVSPPWLRSYNA